MSKYYGTLQSDKGTTTRAGHKWIKATAQSWDLSVSAKIEGEGDGLIVDIRAARKSTDTPKFGIFRGTIKELYALPDKLAEVENLRAENDRLRESLKLLQETIPVSAGGVHDFIERTLGRPVDDDLLDNDGNHRATVWDDDEFLEGVIEAENQFLTPEQLGFTEDEMWTDPETGDQYITRPSDRFDEKQTNRTDDD